MSDQTKRDKMDSTAYYEYMEKRKQLKNKEKNSPNISNLQQKDNKRKNDDESSSSSEEEDDVRERVENEEIRENFDREGKDKLVIKQLRIWAIQYQIPPAHLEPLLVILRARLIPSLPRSAKIFLQSDEPVAPPVKKKKIEEVETVCCNPDILNEILKRLVSIETEVKKSQDKLANIEDCLQVKDDFVSADFSIPTKHEIELPINSVEALLHFEQKLTDDRRCLSDTLQVMKRLKSSKVSISATSILRKFLGRNVATQYTATKKMSDKLVMETHVPKFMGCVLEALMATHEGLCDKEAKAAVGTALTQSKGWDGQRSDRAKKPNNSSTSVIKEEEDILDVDSIISDTWIAERYIDTSGSE